MYLDNAKQAFQNLLELEKEPVHYKPCTLEEVQVLQSFLNLPIPQAYEEFLLWIGKGSDVTDPLGIGHYSRNGTNLQAIALSIMEMNEISQPLPDDAIVFVIYDEASDFAFICANEGNDPPVHFFGSVKTNGEYVHCIQWKKFQTIEEMCLSDIGELMHYHTSIHPPI